MSETLEPQKTWYLVEGDNFTHVFDNDDDAYDMVLGEILVWNGETMEPDCWPYIEEIMESEIPDLDSRKPIRIHRQEQAA